MTTQLYRIFNVLGWPIWLKLSAAFLVAILFPVIVLPVIVQNSFQAINAQNLEETLLDHGQRELETINTTLTQSQLTLETFIVTPAYNQQLNRLLGANGFNVVNNRQVSLSLQGLLLGSGVFQRILVLDVSGRVMADVNSAQMQPGGNDASNSPAYQQATAGLLQNRDKSVSLYNPSNPTLEITQAIRDNTNQVIGYAAATLDIQRALVNSFEEPEDAFPFYSYLITLGQSPIVITRSDTQELADASVNARSVAIERAFRGGSGTSTYRLSGQDGDVIGYYTAVPNPANPQAILFALVAEINKTTLGDPLGQLFSPERIFVMGIGFIGLLIVLVILFNQMITSPLARLQQAIRGVASGNFQEALPAAERGDEIGQVSAAFVDMRSYVRTLLDDLQGRVAARTRDIQATQDITRFVATQRNLQILMDQVVDLIVERFPSIYYGQIFLVDSDRLYAILRASNGEEGKILLARGHRLAVGSVSLVGQAVGQGQTMLARDTSASTIFRRNELLPETRAELTIPLRVGDQVIGALDVQSKSQNAFGEDEITILQTMADQIAFAIENARLYQESLRRLEEIERNNRRATLQTWQEYVYGQRQRQLSSEAGVNTGSDLSELRRRAVAQGRIVMGEKTDHNTIPIAVPITLRGQTLGAVEWELPSHDMSENKLQLAQDLASRLAVSLENARLFQESQRSIERERIVNSIAAKLTPQTEISEILQTAVREVGQALRAPQVSIRLHHTSGHRNGNGADYHQDS